MEVTVLKIPENNQKPGRGSTNLRKKEIAADYNKNKDKFEWQIFTKTLTGECAGDHEFLHLMAIKENGVKEKTNFIRCNHTKCKIGSIADQLIECG